MSQIVHIEKHFTASETIRDVVIGMADGLTVPFALAAGLSGALSSTNLVVTAGMAEITAGAIAMGLGGYLAARTDFEHYQAERKRELREIREIPNHESEEVADIFREYGVSDEQIIPVVKAICAEPMRWADFMMRFELGLEPPNPKRALQSATTIGGSYIFGGLIPLAPYLFVKNISDALLLSTVITLVALFAFGYVKGYFTGVHPMRSGQQTILVGGLAAAAAFGIARAIG
ncbi:VIT1/CCC1 transporter family protein [Rivularia sp. UHCC 0363]|uniref:VIT1/CCC1 transporter family protein n=1 Tax=Rivularia sp. UHCC 0363 TaxID=3110244 RepID=UPI002B1EF1AA|nr:VIT1/CCC1 transporter family protein [Rivularia sp. UHCC 0363]MEA5598842.1 VIT1/CCC1 transporter family protein [Rivularia sp. UHCC 0363]